MARQLTRLQVKSLNGNYWNMLVPKLNLHLVKSFMNWCHRRCVYHYCDKSYNSMKTCRYHYKKLARCLSLFWQILHLSLALSDMATYSDSTVPSLHLLSWLCSWIAGWLASCLDDTKFQLKRCCSSQNYAERWASFQKKHMCHPRSTGMNCSMCGFGHWASCVQQSSNPGFKNKEK